MCKLPDYQLKLFFLEYAPRFFHKNFPKTKLLRRLRFEILQTETKTHFFKTFLKLFLYFFTPIFAKYFYLKNPPKFPENSEIIFSGKYFFYKILPKLFEKKYFLQENPRQNKTAQKLYKTLKKMYFPR